MPRLIVLRGNSASGKSSVAMALRDRWPTRVAYVEQDHMRRIVLRERDVHDGDNIALIDMIVRFALGRNYDVVLEGILGRQRYATMLETLLADYPMHNVFYFNVSFEETLRRHSTKKTANDYGEREMRSWYSADDMLGCPDEVIIEEASTFEETVERILTLAGGTRGLK